MNVLDLISKKKRGLSLSDSEIEYLVLEYTNGNIPDYQMSAFCMAVYFQGMTDEETVSLTMHMAHSGSVIDLSSFGNLSCDKHSSGGVGDKTTLIVAPIVASLGGVVAKMSGRGLGHTGGTVDKLESIPGYRTTLSSNEFMTIAKECGIAVCGQSGNLAPADKKLYALRDASATVDSLPLIASSIMSKKIASGAKNITLDVKCGSGAFMKTKSDALALARQMVKIGNMCGIRTKALITDMNTPLGFAIGNSLEVIEAAEVLKGNVFGDIREVSLALSACLISSFLDVSNDEARSLCEMALDSKRAYAKFCEWIEAQGGNADYIENTSLFDSAKFKTEIKSDRDGYIYSTDTEKIGLCSCELGAGRKKKDDTIDLCSGIMLKKKTGDFVRKGDVLATLYTNRENTVSLSCDLFKSALVFSDDSPKERSLILERVE